MKGSTVAVIKEGGIIVIPENELQLGDVLLLQAGDLVPADLKLIEARSLEIDEFELKGEIMPIIKTVGIEDVFLYRGSRVVRGNGKGIVIASGEETEYGEILGQRSGQVKYRFPSLLKGKYFLLPLMISPFYFFTLNRFGNPAIISTIYIIIAIFFILIQNNELFKYVVTLNEIKKIRSQNIEISDEYSLETLSKTNIVCFDKTGVLTTREMKVKNIHYADKAPDIDAFSLDKENLCLSKLGFTLCNDVIYLEKIGQADPIDKALIYFALNNGVNVNEIKLKYKRIYDKPFDSQDRFMACGFEYDGEKIYFSKGDPDIILKMCSNYITYSGEINRLNSDFLLSIRLVREAMSKNGDITIALAYNHSSSEVPPLNYTFLCLIQLENPVKTGIPDVIRRLEETGIRSMVLTGDKPETALKVGREIGINDEVNVCLTGKNISQMELSEVARQSDKVSIFARLLPSQKGVLIRSMQGRKIVVAMVGDGANDVIALKVADVGVSFKENSSPLARRVAKILINDVADILTLFHSARRVEKQLKCSGLLRVIITISILALLYHLMLT